MTASRIVSLLPSSTEILFGLGLGPRVVGVSHECDWPPEAKGLPVLTEKRIDTDRPSREIDAAIAELAARRESVYRVRADRLAALRPDLIVTQDVCDVCAVSTVDVRAALEEARRTSPDLDPAVLSLAPASVAEILQDIRRVGKAAGAEDAADALVEDLEKRIRHITDAVEAVAFRPRVTAIDWLDPLILGGDWIPEMVRMAGGTPQPLPSVKAARIAWEDVAAFEPEVIVVMPCGFDLERTVAESAILTKQPGFANLPAARWGRVYAVDGNALFNRPSQRIVDSLEALAEMLHPNLFRGTVPSPGKIYRRLDLGAAP
jgi:iron complex transport system substrate-binding protein